MAAEAMKRKSSEEPSDAPPAKHNSFAIGLADLPPQCVGKVFEWVDLRTRVRAMRVCRAVHAGIDFYGPLLSVLSLKQSLVLYFDVYGRFLVNNEVSVAEADLPDVIAWMTSRFKGHTFELVLESHRLGKFAYEMFLQLEGLKSVRVIFKTYHRNQARFCHGLSALLRQSADTLESLALEVSVSARLLAAVAKCRRLKSLAFEGLCSYVANGGNVELAWPDLPLLERVHLAGTQKLRDAIKRSLIAAFDRRPFQLELQGLDDDLQRVVSTSVYWLGWIALVPIEGCPRLNTIIALERGNLASLGYVARALPWLFAQYAGKPHRELLVVAATMPSLSERCEMRSVLPAVRWPVLPPTRDDDDELTELLRVEATRVGVVGLSVRYVDADEVSPLLHLPASMRSRRQLELSTASLTVRLVLLPDYDGGAEDKVDSADFDDSPAVADCGGASGDDSSFPGYDDDDDDAAVPPRSLL